MPPPPVRSKIITSMNQGSDPVVSVIGAQMAKLQVHHARLRTLQGELSAWTDAGKAEAEDARARNDHASVTSAVDNVRPQVNHLLGDIQACAASMLPLIDGIFAAAAKDAVPLAAEDDLTELRATVQRLSRG